jgi:hypothetical protein
MTFTGFNATVQILCTGIVSPKLQEYDTHRPAITELQKLVDPVKALGGFVPRNVSGNVDVASKVAYDLKVDEFIGSSSAHVTITLPYPVEEYPNIKYRVRFVSASNQEQLVQVYKVGAYWTNPGYAGWSEAGQISVHGRTLYFLCGLDFDWVKGATTVQILNNGEMEGLARVVELQKGVKWLTKDYRPINTAGTVDVSSWVPANVDAVWGGHGEVLVNLPYNPNDYKNVKYVVTVTRGAFNSPVGHPHPLGFTISWTGSTWTVTKETFVSSITEFQVVSTGFSFYFSSNDLTFSGASATLQILCGGVQNGKLADLEARIAFLEGPVGAA